MTAKKILRPKFRNCNALRMELGQRGAEVSKVLVVYQDNDIAVSAKLRCAVQYARLTSDKQVPDHVA
jgi:hypothetical protein